MEDLSHTKMKNCEYLGKAISSALMLGGRYTPRQWSWQKFLSPQKWWPFWIFKVFAKHKNAYISKTVPYGVNSTKFWTCWVSLQSSHANFQNIFVSPNIADIFNFFMSTPLGGGYIIFAFFAVRCPMSDVRCPMSDVRRPMSGVTHGFRSFKGKVLELLSPNLVCRLIGSVACLGLLLAVVPLLLTE